MNFALSAPSSAHVTAPIAPVRLGVVDVYAAFSEMLLSARFVIVSADVSEIFVTVTATAFVAELPSASVALSVKL